MLDNLISPRSKEHILIFLAGRTEGYAREIAKYYRTSLSSVQNQLLNLETGGIVYSKKAGKTIIYNLNPRYVFYKELVELLKKAINFLPDSEKEKLLMNRKRPRRKGKPL